MVSKQTLIAEIRVITIVLVMFSVLLISACSPQSQDAIPPGTSTAGPVSQGIVTADPARSQVAAMDQVDEGVTPIPGSGEVLEATGVVPASDEIGSARQSETIDPEDWKDLPVIPEIGERAREIFRSGVAAGNDPRSFAKVGDCQNVPSMFLSIFDYPGYYSLGAEYDYLQETIDWYQGSFSRESEAVRRGFNAASVVSPVWADPEACASGESPLACEIRINNPSIAIISLETWWAGNPENYEKYVRQIIEGLLEHEILPIVATKADNLEGDHQINMILVKLAMEYQIPVWNFWRAVQPLPGNGLLEDRFHLTFDENHFDDPEAMKAAWPWRNLTALQVLDKIRTELVLEQ
ncbi:MAG: SGNH/GDSL hydrolase family protein [Anaerolineales bacterium]|nr:SGNH/GDSL hydrolase family protein [Anaerolineales bacterium]